MKRWEVEKLFDETGLVAIITATERKTERGTYVNYSVGFFREFQRTTDSEVERSSFLRDHQLDSLRRLLGRVDERIQHEIAKQHAKERAERNQRVVPSRDEVPRPPQR